MDPALVPLEEFEGMVVDALDTLPDWLTPLLSEIAVLVHDDPPPGSAPPGQTLLGVFTGVPTTTRGGRVPGTAPDTIVLYRRPILRASESREAARERVLKVLGHEVGHALGFGEAQLRSLGWH